MADGQPRVVTEEVLGHQSPVAAVRITLEAQPDKDAPDGSGRLVLIDHWSERIDQDQLLIAGK